MYLSYSSRAFSTASKNPGMPSPVKDDTPTASHIDKKRSSAITNARAYLQMLVELVQDETHTVHQAIHITGFTIPILIGPAQ